LAAEMKNKLRELRKQRNLTQEELAGFLKVSRQTIIAIENNKYDPSLSLALKMARFFSVPVEEIFTPDRI
jgi:putative transcriptional regulator